MGIVNRTSRIPRPSPTGFNAKKNFELWLQTSEGKSFIKGEQNKKFLYKPTKLNPLDKLIFKKDYLAIILSWFNIF